MARGSTLIIAAALVGLALACNLLNGEDCQGAPCSDQVSIFAHLPVRPVDLVGGTITLCRDGECSTGTITEAAPSNDAGAAASDGATDADADAAAVDPGSAAPPPSNGDCYVLVNAGINGGGCTLTGSLGGGAEIWDELDGFTRIELDPSTAASGNYRVFITDAKGATLIDVTRPLTLTRPTDECGGSCQTISADFYPASASGVSCPSSYCIYPGAHLLGHFTPPTFDDVEVQVCRNGVCAESKVGFSAVDTDSCRKCACCTTYGGTATGPIFLTVGVSPNGSSVSFDAQTVDDSAALQDGDRYAVTITQNGATLFSGSGVAKYDAEQPNGAQCDPIPCRHAKLSL